jgi:hypothetical protein
MEQDMSDEFGFHFERRVEDNGNTQKVAITVLLSVFRRPRAT